VAGLTSRTGQTVHDGERRERFHDVWIGLVDKPAGEPALVVEVEVAVLDQQGHLERGPLRQAKLAFAPITDDPKARKSRVDIELGDAHDMVVVPEQRRALVHRVVEDRGLSGREEILGPAVIWGWRERAMEMNDGVARERGRVLPE